MGAEMNDQIPSILTSWQDENGLTVQSTTQCPDTWAMFWLLIHGGDQLSVLPDKTAIIRTCQAGKEKSGQLPERVREAFVSTLARLLNKTQYNLCECECGKQHACEYFPDDDQRLRITLEKRLGGLENFQLLVKSAETYVDGDMGDAEFTKEVRSIIAKARQ